MKKLFQNTSLDKKLNFVVVLLLFIALVIASMYLSLKSYATFDTLVETNSKEINKQIIFNYETHFNEIRSIARYIELETKNEDNVNSEPLQYLYESFVTINPDIVSISLVSQTGNIEISSEDNYTQMDSLEEREWYTKALTNDSVYFFSEPHTQDLFENQTEQVISVSKKVDYYKNYQLYEGVLIIEINTDKIETLAKQTNLGEEGHLIIISDSNEIIYSSASSCSDDTCESVMFIKETIIGGSFTEIEENDFFMSINTLEGTRWRIATFINVDIISQTKTQINIMLIGVFVVTLITSSAIVATLTRSITKPLNILKNHMKDVSHSDHLYKEINIKGQKEVVILADAYNGMIKEIRRLLRRLVQEQTDKRKKELIALQTQINPHFLYNTLDSIVWLSEQKQTDEVIEMVIALSRFFRISISRGKDIIDIKDEIAHAKYYLRIQKIRYVNKFEYSMDIEEGVEQYQTVKLILQPIIENAITHGLGVDQTGKIDIKVYTEEDSVLMSITNSGYGITEKQIEEIYDMIENDNHKSVGLKNVAQRLKLYYGEKAGIKITSVLDESTTFCLHFPIERGES